MLSLTYLAEEVDDEFEDVTVVIDGDERKTLIVHTPSDQTADSVISFLEDLGARTEREWYDEDDVRVLAVPG